MKSAFKGLFKAKKPETTGSEEMGSQPSPVSSMEKPASPAAPAHPRADTAKAALPFPVQFSEGSNAAAAIPAVAADDAAKVQTLNIAQELAKMDLSGKMDCKLQFAHLNTKVCGFIASSLHSSMTPQQVDRINKSLGEAKEMFAKNMCAPLSSVCAWMNRLRHAGPDEVQQFDPAKSSMACRVQ